MTHLTPEHVVDAAADQTLDPRAAAHLEQCPSCQSAVAEWRSLVEDVAGAGAVPEPSPLFWDHLNRRVRDATAAEPAPVPVPWWQQLWRPVVAASALAGAIALVVIARHGPPAAPLAVPDSAPALAAESAGNEDIALEVMTAAVGDLSFDDLRQADFVPSRAAIDLAVSRLSDAQQRELMRLVREEWTGVE